MLLILKKLINSFTIEYPDISEFGKFEALIFCTLFVVTEIANKFPQDSDEIIVSFKHFLIFEGQNVKLPLSDIELENHIMERIIQFEGEINSLDSGYTYNAIFINPLQFDSRRDLDNSLFLGFKLFGQLKIQGVCEDIFNLLQIEIAKPAQVIYFR